MKSLEVLKKEILEDGVIDAQEVKEIEGIINEDGKIDKAEADFMFELNDAVSGKNNHSSWQDLFVKTLSSFVLDDDASNGEIDENETEYLVNQIHGDGKIDSTEKALLENLKSKLGSLPESLEKLL
jgi:uncharacterized membrane protein YebE (DUF533 family)